MTGLVGNNGHYIHALADLGYQLDSMWDQPNPEYLGIPVRNFLYWISSGRKTCPKSELIQVRATASVSGYSHKRA